MKIHENKTKNRLLIKIAVSVVLLILASSCIYLYIKSQTINSESAESPVTSDQIQSKELEKDPTVKEKQQNTDTPPEPEDTKDDTGKQKVQLEVSSDVSDNTLFIRGGINYPVSGGRCFAKLLGPNGQEITKETQLLQGPASTDCQTISVPLTELTTGEWSITLNYDSNKYIGISANVKFSI